MTDNKITREKTFSEELPYFKERIQEVFDNYHNPNGYEDPLYISVLRDSKRIVRKAEEEINRQQEEIEKLKKEIDNYDVFYFCSYDGCESASTDCWKTCPNSIYNKTRTESYQECLAKVKNYIKTHCNPYGKPDFDYNTSIKILNFIDSFAQEM